MVSIYYDYMMIVATMIIIMISVVAVHEIPGFINLVTHEYGLNDA